MDRNAQSALHQCRRSIGRRARSTEAVEFFNVLTSPQLLQTTEALLPEHRERLYPPTVTLSMFPAGGAADLRVPVPLRSGLYMPHNERARARAALAAATA